MWELYSLGNIPYPGLHWDITFVQKLKEGLRNPAPEYAQNIVYVSPICLGFILYA